MNIEVCRRAALNTGYPQIVTDSMHSRDFHLESDFGAALWLFRYLKLVVISKRKFRDNFVFLNINQYFNVKLTAFLPVSSL